ncbi:sodium:proton antiporter [Hypericibacter adhaerens]|uniref:Sodium:proton antiporter n=1 Tax=Hypericibacter adhaerens TaxID=2602016 RepID=A0A5J6MUN7_9PROT|nr:YbaL family putative K(+) efflux transporter [Hypericibacter adhaerens]QEX20894.1 sodium:proton antiporter [Hypericibacter adhaerens]
MPHHTPLIATIVIGLVLAFILGAVAQRLRISPLVGYLLAGVIAGPHTPGFIADQGLANELAEIGVILLMFGVGLHFSLKDLLSVRAIAIPGAIVQIAVATLMGMGLALLLSWPWAQGFVFGLALSVASTVVLLRALQERRLLETERGKIAVGWLIVEDIAMVAALVLLPALADAVGGNGGAPAGGADPIEILKVLGIALGKVAAFIALMLVVGRRVIPWILHYIAHTGSRELFRLAVLAVALGTAYGATTLFDVSFALGAFFAGMILAESELSRQATNETLPLRDAFAVLFFVSVGMLFDPKIVIDAPLVLLATIAIILIGKSTAAYLIVRLFGHPRSTALTISASLAQIGEFSFILAGLGVTLGLLTEEGRDLILAGAIITILLNPLAFWLMERISPHRAEGEEGSDGGTREPVPVTALTGHAIVIGYGRVGSLVGAGLGQAGWPFLVLEEIPELAEAARQHGAETILGNAADPELLNAANPAQARVLFVAIPQAFEAGQIVAQARGANPHLKIIARAHSDAEVEHLQKHGADLIIMGEREIAQGMLAAVLPLQSPPGPPELTVTPVM